MGILTLTFGQCGNQIGHTLFNFLYDDIMLFKDPGIGAADNLDYEVQATDRWFRRNKQGILCGRTVLVDTEAKAIDAVHTSSDRFIFPRRVKESCGGAGNNWAYGYYDIGNTMCENIMEEIRQEVEYCDSASGFLCLMSSSGGTGSGVGTFTIEKIRDEYPNKPVASAIVLPYENGEVVTQNYNTVLTLTKLYDFSDMVAVFQNDQLQNVVEKLLKIDKVEFYDINKLIALKLASVFQPAEGNTLWNIVDHLTSHPSYKLVHIKTAPHAAKENAQYEAVAKWPELILHAKQMMRAAPSLDWEIKYASSSVKQTMDYTVSVSNLLLTRGKRDGTLNTDCLKEDSLYPAWVPPQARLMHSHQRRRLWENNLFLTLVTNNAAVHRQIDKIVHQAWTMFAFEACVHQYTKFGMEKVNFEDAFGKIETVIKNYRDLELK